MNPAVPTWAGVAASLALVALAVVIAVRQRLHLAREIAIAAARAGIQLAAVGAILLLVFRHAGLAGAAGWLAIMVLIAGQVAARRARGLPRALPVATTAVAAATGATIGTLLALGVISTQARVVIPVGGMIVSGAMAATAVTLTRLREEAAAARPAIETRLCLGQPAAQAFAPQPARRAAHRKGPPVTTRRRTRLLIAAAAALLAVAVTLPALLRTRHPGPALPLRPIGELGPARRQLPVRLRKP